MLNHVLTKWDRIRTSLWFLPSFMVLAAIGLAVVTLHTDAGQGSEDAVRAWWLNAGDGEDARNLLSTLLTATITMASIAFSVTVVALSLAANQFGSRLVRTFRADLRNQVTLGCFVGTIVYCLLVLRSIEGKAPITEVPRVSTTIGTFLSLLCVLALLAFIQGVARSIVADEVVRRVAHDLDKAVARLPPLEKTGVPELPGPHLLPPDFGQKAASLPLHRDGYVQAVDYDGLTQWAEARNSLLCLEFRAGDFVVAGDHRILLYNEGGTADDGKPAKELAEFVVIGNERTPTQDLEFPIRHLVEIAVRALSPGINDPFTAIAVIDHLRGALSRVMERRLPPAVIRDASSRVRVVGETSTYAGIIDAAFNQLRQAGASKPAVSIHLLEAIRRIAGRTKLKEQREALDRQARMIGDAALRTTKEDLDRDGIEQSQEAALQETVK